MELHLDLPIVGMALIPLELMVSGWLKDFSHRLERISIRHRELFKEVPFSRINRVDLSSQPNSLGYEFGINLKRLDLPEVIDVCAHLEGVRDPRSLCSIIIEYVDIPLRESKIPLIVTGLGRSGSSYFMELLSTHREIAVLGPFPYEERIASYFCDVFHSMTRFRTTAESLPRYSEDNVLPFNQLINPANLSSLISDARFSFLRELLTICANDVKELVDLHYSNLCTSSAKEAPVFAEKLIGAFHTQELILSIYDTAVEVILIRDFRDTFTSAMMFNRKRGYPAFGRERWNSDIEWLINFADDVETIMHASQLRPNALVVKYEEIIRAPERILGKVCSRIGITPPGAAGLRMPDSKTRRHQSHRTSKSAIKSISRWKQELPDDLKKLANERLEDYLRYFGYEL